MFRIFILKNIYTEICIKYAIKYAHNFKYSHVYYIYFLITNYVCVFSLLLNLRKGTIFYKEATFEILKSISIIFKCIQLF